MDTSCATAPRLTAKEVLALVAMRRMVETGQARELRRRARLSLAEVAAAIGLTPGGLSRWENNLRRPGAGASARAYAKLLQQLNADDITSAS